MIHLFADTILYAFKLEPVFAIPFVYTITYLVCRGITEFIHGWLKYLLILLFVGSFATLWYILMLDYSPWPYVALGFVLFGAVSGMSRHLANLLNALRKI